MEQINWYPGHMKKTRELIQENLKLVDAVVEVLDARIPRSSRNPILADLTKGKIRIVALNKSDLADGQATEAWAEELRAAGDRVLVLNCNSGEGAKALKTMLAKLRDEKNEGRERKRPLRLMIVGIPNVGKSSLINRLTGSKGAKTGDKPGVTRGKQWLKLGEDIHLLDTPGILWPKFEDPKVGQNLAFCGSVPGEILNLPSLALELIARLSERYPQELCARYRLDALPGPGSSKEDAGAAGEDESPAGAALATMEAIAAKRGFLLGGGRIDYERTARTLLDEFRAAKIGRISLEWPEGSGGRAKAQTADAQAPGAQSASEGGRA